MDLVMVRIPVSEISEDMVVEINACIAISRCENLRQRIEDLKATR